MPPVTLYPDKHSLKTYYCFSPRTRERHHEAKSRFVPFKHSSCSSHNPKIPRNTFIIGTLAKSQFLAKIKTKAAKSSDGKIHPRETCGWAPVVGGRICPLATRQWRIQVRSEVERADSVERGTKRNAEMKNTRADEDRCVENREVNRSQSEKPPRSRYSFLRLFALDLLCERGSRSNARRRHSRQMNERRKFLCEREAGWDQLQYALTNPSQVRYPSVVPRVCPERCLESKCCFDEYICTHFIPVKFNAYDVYVLSRLMRF